MHRGTIFRFALGLAAALLFLGGQTEAQTKRLSIDHADYSEIVFSKLPGEPDTLYYGGSVVARTESGMIYCDTAVIAIGERALLIGRVILEDEVYRLAADDSVRYDLNSGKAEAFGPYVQLFSAEDSLMAVGTNAYFDRNREYFYMLDRPTVYLNYPDSAAMIEVVGNVVQYDAANEVAEAEGAVRISTEDINSKSDCAILRPKDNALDLFGSPSVFRGRSEISGSFIALSFGAESIEFVDVVDSAYAEFVEPTDSTEEHFDRSILSGKRLVLLFDEGDLASAVCRTQAYSWYFPYAQTGADEVLNEVSGDSIHFAINNNELLAVDVVGGAIGRYQTTRREIEDSVVTEVTDTIDYRAEHITYALNDSMITLQSGAETKSGTMQLAAHRVELNTATKVVEAFGGELPQDLAMLDTLFLPELRPSQVPVVLMDAKDTLFGDYLEYSIDTEKGRIVTSQSAYESGKFYGQRLYRQSRDVYYMDNARYTTCDLDGFHFASSKVKLIEGRRLIAKPVVMYIKRLPILAIPFYVFPLEKGRHSGFLPFTIGNIERGERYIENVGYYWAASEYWDLQGALDYFEERNRLNLYGKFSYNKLYSFDGYIDGNYGRESDYNRTFGEVETSARWTIGGRHQQTVSPSFQFTADGQYVSDRDFYIDYSTDPTERLNRTIRSQVNFTKSFGKSVSISGKVSHDENLDNKSRTDQFPSLSVRVPNIRPFGSGGTNDEGQRERQWYNDLVITYRPSLLNFSTRSTTDSIANSVYQYDTLFDTTITVIDSVTSDTSVTTTIDSTLIVQDTLELRSRREYTRADHSFRANLPFNVAKYIRLNPSISYEEEWFRIYETDQSRAAGIDASQFYRAYVYSAGVSASTDLYGTVYPNAFGLLGLRQVVSPSVSYRYRPEIDRHPVISAYAGGGARATARSQSVSFGVQHLYQAKVKAGEADKNLSLMTINHSLSYDFEKDTRRWSDVNSTFSSTLIKDINIRGSARHSLYKQNSDELDFLNPRLQSFDLSASVSLRGTSSFFDDPVARIPRGVDSASQLARSNQRTSSSAKGWNVSGSYTYSETGIGTAGFRRSSFVNYSLSFYLTPVTKIDYSQSYNFVTKQTVSSRVRITRKLHCWTGEFFWVPTGSLKGWGFKLFVTGLPEVKIDQSQGTLSSSYFQNLR